MVSYHNLQQRTIKIGINAKLSGLKDIRGHTGQNLTLQLSCEEYCPSLQLKATNSGMETCAYFRQSIVKALYDFLLVCATGEGGGRNLSAVAMK